MTREQEAREALAQAYAAETSRPIRTVYWREWPVTKWQEGDRYALAAMLAFADRTAASVRAEALEEAAGVAEAHAAPGGVPQIDYDRAVHDIAAAIHSLSASDAPARGGGWKPIKTAPKDGTRVLLWLGAPWSCIETAAWYVPWANWQTGRYFAHSESDECAGIGSSVPTHWQPLPAAPDQATEIVAASDGEGDRG